MNDGAIAFHEGILFVGENFGRGRVLVFDAEGRGVHAGFELGARSVVSGLVADSDRRLWIADTAARRVRAWNVFGREDAGFVARARQPETASAEDGPLDVALAPGEAYTGVWVASGGVRRGAVGLFLPDGTRLEVLRSEGDPKRAFEHVVRLATAGELIGVLERGRARVQVFRGLDFHFAIPLERALGELRRSGGAGRPVALGLLDDGSALVGFGPGEGLRDGEAHPERILWLEPSGHVRREVLSSAGPTHPGGATIAGLVDFALEDTHHGTALYVLDQLGQRVQVFNLEGRHWGSFETDAPFVAE